MTMASLTHTPRFSSPTLRFARHYGEMVLVMLVGMLVFGMLERPFFSFGDLLADAPAAGLAVMSVNMTVPMVAWMRWRGHGWAPTAEMAGSMIVPTLVVLVPLAAGVLTDGHALMGIQHALMFPAMLGVMLMRRREYSH